jgi:PAS domain S-box-containing protein
MDTLRQGAVAAIEDTGSDPRLTPSERAALQGIDIGAVLGIPLVRDGRVVAVLSTHSRTPRPWTEDDIGLVHEVAARTWPWVERARVQVALQESEARFRALAEMSPLGVAVSSTEGEIVYSNRAYAEILGLEPDDLVGRPSTFVYYDPADRNWLAAMREKGHLRGVEVRFRHKDGDPVWVSINVAPIDYGGPNAIIGVVQDITERKHAEEALRQSGERHAFLLTLSDTLRAQPDEASIETQAVTMLAEHMHLDRCWISKVFDEQGFSTVGPEHHRPDLQPMSGVFQLAEYPETMWQLATEPMVIPDAASDDRFSEPEKALLAGLHLGALLVTPLRKGERKVVWALAAATETPHRWTEGQRELLEDVAERTWVAVERARTERVLRESEERLRRLHEQG